jgi:sterol desaturase/sphingolipid hydroxylase (fatty acid hydroxylase superfamily)
MVGALEFGTMDWRIWGRKYQLDKMSHGELVLAYVVHPAIQIYVVIAGVSSYISWRLADALLPVVLAIVLVVAVYPFAWYLLHRFVLHGALYRRRVTARVWKRIHFDHHRDPHDLRVLFGALYTTLPTVALVVIPIGWLVGGAAAAAAALATGLIVTCVYEYCHCIQHLPYAPRIRYLRAIKARHLQHHFHDERFNYGITSFLPDRILGTYRDSAKAGPRSATVFNLGYVGEERRRFPWVARLTPGLEHEPDDPREAGASPWP